MIRFATALFAAALLPAAAAAAKSPKPLEPRHTLKPPAGEGYFDDVFAIDAEGKRLAAIRTDGATFSKLELYDVSHRQGRRRLRPAEEPGGGRHGAARRQRGRDDCRPRDPR